MILILNYIHSSSNWLKIVKLRKIVKLSKITLKFPKFEIIPKFVKKIEKFHLIVIWFGLVMFWLGLVWFRIIWCLSIVQICYNAKSGGYGFKDVRVMPTLVLFGMVWFGLVLYWSASFGVCSSCRYVTMQNLELVSSKMSELCQF